MSSFGGGGSTDGSSTLDDNDNNAGGEELYDEFGNYIGPDLDDEEDDEQEDSEEDDVDSDVSEEEEMDKDPAAAGEDEAEGDKHKAEFSEGTPSTAIVLHEDKVHYPSASEVYGPDVRTAVLDEDAMDLDTPLVEPVKVHDFSLLPDSQATARERQRREEGDDSDQLLLTDLTNPQGDEDDLEEPSPVLKRDNDADQDEWVSDVYLATLLSNAHTSESRRGVALVGHLHTGKTTLVDLLLHHTRRKPPAKPVQRVTDTLQAEQQRQLSLKSSPLTVALPDGRGKSRCFTLLDCPGHVQFHDESVAALKGADGVLLTVDAVEGVMMHTELLLRQMVLREGLPLVLLITKVDRLWLELKLSPTDAYYKLRHVIDSVNALISKLHKRYPLLNPARGNVAFSSATHGWIFTTASFAQTYANVVKVKEHRLAEEQTENNNNNNNKTELPGPILGKNLTAQDFARRLWGDIYWNAEDGTFSKRGNRRTFVSFILEPLYKIYTACLGEAEADVERLFRRSLEIPLHRRDLREASQRPLLRTALSKFFGSTTVSSLVDMMMQHLPSPERAAQGKVDRCYTGASDSAVAKSMKTCSAHGPLMMHVVKLYAASDGQSFSAFGRLYSGTVKPGDRVKVLGEGFVPDVDEEDMALATVTAVSVVRGRRRVDLTKAIAGNWVWLDGVDAHITKTATIASIKEEEVAIFCPLTFHEAGGEAVMKLAVEPLNPAELPKMVEGLRRISKSYPMARTRVEESGEHVLFGTGELYLDCAMHDLRHVYSDMEVKVADPVVAFRETVVDTSRIKCFAETANKRNKLTAIAEPLDDGLAERLEAGLVNHKWEKKKMGRFFQQFYDWDLLTSRSVWAFGPSSSHGTNVLLDDTLPSEVNTSLWQACKSSTIQGFQWATREGPLCEEPVRSTKVKILEVALADKPIHRGGGQIIPAARRTVHSALLTATPRLMEPYNRLQIQCPGPVASSLPPLLSKRRGHIVQETPLAGTPLTLLKAFVPVLDSFGLETDVRVMTQGQAMVHGVLDHWKVVPGDPLDGSVVLHPLEPSPPQHLAREVLVKTRRRKGLSEDVRVSQFLDPAMREALTREAAADPMETS